MNVLEKAEKALEYLKNHEGVAKSHELQTTAGTLGRCLGALGTRPNCARHYANLLSTAVPTLLGLASHESAEVRLAGDEALNRVTVGGFAFNSYKTNVILLNQIDVNKNARWNRAAISRICLGDCWLRPGVGKIRSQAQTLFPKISQVVRNTKELQLVVEAFESNLPRLLNALAEYTTDEEMYDLLRSLLSRVESAEASVRRGVGACVAHLCSHRESLLPHVLDKAFENLWPMAVEDNTAIGWFCVIKAVFEINDMSKFTENGLFTVQDYLEVYQLCLAYVERCSSHNVQNAVLECLGELLGRAHGAQRRALLDPRPGRVTLGRARRGHSPSVCGRAGAGPPPGPPGPPPPRELELAFSGALRLGSALRLDTPTSSIDDLNIHTPDSEDSEPELAPEPAPAERPPRDHTGEDDRDTGETALEGPQLDVGPAEADSRLLHCARLLAARYLLAGARGRLLPDRRVRVSVKAGALRCLRAALRLSPRPAARYLLPAADRLLDCSGSSEGPDSNPDDIDEFILERNVCYQDSITESINQDLLKSSDSILNSKRDAKSLEKSLESELRSSKDVPSNILDSRLAASGFSADTNMTSSILTSASTTDGQSAGYPPTSSGGLLSSSLDLDMRFDHFADAPAAEPKEAGGQTQPDALRGEAGGAGEGGEGSESGEGGEAECQHMSDVFLLAAHADPQVRGLARVCAAAYLAAALDASQGDYARWRGYAALPKDVADTLSIEKLMDLILTGLRDEIHSAVNHTLSALSTLALALSRSVHWELLSDMLNALVTVETNSYWLCRLNLVKLYETLPYQRLGTLSARLGRRGAAVAAALARLLADRDQRVRAAAAQAIASIAPVIHISPRATPASMLAETARQASRPFRSHCGGLALERVREMHFYSDLPAQLRAGRAGELRGVDSLSTVVGDVVARLMASNCKYYTQGLLASLHALCLRWSPWRHGGAYRGHGALALCLARLAGGAVGGGGGGAGGGGVAERAVCLDLCRLLYPETIHDVMRHKSNRNMFDTQEVKEKWQHLENEKVAILCENFLQVTLKMLNMVVHCVEEVHPSVHAPRAGLALPGSPVRRRAQDSTSRKSSMSSETAEEKGSLKKKPHAPPNSLKANFAGHFFTEPMYMKQYDSLRAAYSNHKINLDPKGSIFYEFLSIVLDSLAIQLEFSTEVEFGPITEEILYYLKVTMPLCPDKSVYCVTQLLKCLFGTNMINQYSDFMSIADKETKEEKASFFEDVMLMNDFSPEPESESRRSSVCSGSSQGPERGPAAGEWGPAAAERQLLAAMEGFNKNRMDRKWGTNKKELERYIRMFEPAVIQALKTYTLQHDAPLQCAVLQLLGQLLALRVNYCMLDSEQLFVGFLMKQLELLEQHEIPNCCELVKSILLFLVQLSSSKHHTKQIIEIPKLIQLCDGLLAAGAQLECVAGLEPVALRVFGEGGGAAPAGGGAPGRAQQQELQATREVIFYMLQKTMHLPQVMEVVACVVSLARRQRGGGRWAALAADTLLALLAARGADCGGGAAALERLLAALGRDVLLEQARVELLLKILFKAPPDQATTPRKLKLRYLIITLVLLRKVLVLIPESEILLSINYLKSTCIAPQSIFFNVRPDTDPLNVQSVNETCANLSPDVILVRFLFRTLTYAILELDDVAGGEGGEDEGGERGAAGERGAGERGDELLYSVCVGLVVHVKHMLHLADGCAFPLSAKSAQSLLQQEQSGFNTGLYSPDENIPLDALNRRCLRARPALTLHWSHLLVRVRFLAHGYWQRLTGYARELPLRADAAPPRADSLQLGVALAYCEHFVENGLGEVVHLTWLLANRVRLLLAHAAAPPVQRLLAAVQQLPGASALLLQAVAARCQGCLQGEFALNTYKVLSLCHESQSGALVFFICRIIGKLEPALAGRFASLAVERCRSLSAAGGADGADAAGGAGAADGAGAAQLGKEDVQVALELLQRDGAHRRHTELVSELNALAAALFDLSPLGPAGERAVLPRAVRAAQLDQQWLLLQAKTRCCQHNNSIPKVPRYKYLAQFLSKFPLEDLTTIMSCPEFDRKIIGACFKIACDSFMRDFLDVLSVHESREAERDMMRRQREMSSEEEMTPSVDSNKLNVVNIHVFKKSDNKESKSQFFIPMTSIDNEIQEKFGNLKITDEECEISVPELPKLYIASVSALDKMLAGMMKLFPKQSRPPSQAEGGPSERPAADRSRRRLQAFRDRQFHREFAALHAVLAAFLRAADSMTALVDEADCDLLEKCIENIIPSTLQRNLAVFCVISLQYLSFLISNKQEVEVPVNPDVSFRANVPADSVSVEHALASTVRSVAAALACGEVWAELDAAGDAGPAQAAVCCLYAVVEYLVKDKKPLILKSHIQNIDDGPKADLIVTGDKLISLIEYWEQNFYIKRDSNILEARYEKPIEKLLVSLARLEALSNVALVPPLGWAQAARAGRGGGGGGGGLRAELPLPALQDADVLEAFLFRVNLVGWSSKKQFEEVWVGLLGALQGNGPHWAVRGAAQLLAGAAHRPVRGRSSPHVPRAYLPLGDGMQRLRSILVGSPAYRLFEDVNLERELLGGGGLQYGQFSTDYLRLASGLTEDAPYRVRREVRRRRRRRPVDLDSCVQLLLDVAADMLEPKAPTGLAARVALLGAVGTSSAAFGSAGVWRRAAALLGALPAAHWPHAATAALHALAACLPVLHAGDALELAAVHDKLLKSLSSSYAPLRQAALRGWLLQLAHAPVQRDTLAVLRQTLTQQLAETNKVSVYEQGLCWAALLELAPAQPELAAAAAGFLAARPHHYCADLVARGIISILRQRVLPKDLKKSIVEKLLDNMNNYSEDHAVQILLVHLFSADNKLVSPKQRCDVSDMDPDVLMSTMERITLLYKTLRCATLRTSQHCVATALRYFLRETLPPAATLSRAVIEFLESCRESETAAAGVLGERDRCGEAAVLNCEVVFEVFEAAVRQQQLPVLGGWLFEALQQLLCGRVSARLLPRALLPLLAAASPAPLRALQPLALLALHAALLEPAAPAAPFAERRLLCLLATRSHFTEQQRARLRELCEEHEHLDELRQCLLELSAPSS